MLYIKNKTIKGAIMPKTIQSPAEVLKAMLVKYQLNGNRLSKAIGSNYANVNLILNGKSRISLPVALRLSKFFGIAPDYWLAAQLQYDLSLAAKDKKLQKALGAIKKVTKPVKAPAKAPAKASKAKKRPAARTKKGA